MRVLCTLTAGIIRVAYQWPGGAGADGPPQAAPTQCGSGGRPGRGAAAGGTLRPGARITVTVMAGPGPSVAGHRHDDAGPGTH